MRRLRVMVAVVVGVLSFGVVGAVGAEEAKVVHTSNPLGPMMNEPFRFYEAGTLVGAKGSFFIPDAAAGQQMLPNIVEIDCLKGDMCVIVTVNLLPDALALPGGPDSHISLNVDYLSIVEWSDAVVRARDDSPACATLDYVLYRRIKGVRLEKQAKTAKPECGSSTYTAYLGFVLWTPKGR